MSSLLHASSLLHPSSKDRELPGPRSCWCHPPEPKAYFPSRVFSRRELRSWTSQSGQTRLGGNSRQGAQEWQGCPWTLNWRLRLHAMAFSSPCNNACQDNKAKREVRPDPAKPPPVHWVEHQWNKRIRSICNGSTSPSIRAWYIFSEP